MIFQEPMTSLNPVFRIGNQISEAVRLHQNLPASQAREKAVDMLKAVGIPSAALRFKDYPHQLSGGMRQRVMIAMAFSCNPDILIADEPTTALDVTIQAQILELIETLKMRFKMSVLMVTHDLGVIAETAERVCVMYAGKIVEDAPVKGLFRDPLHPYTLGLLESLPRLKEKRGKRKRLKVIPGMVPDLVNMPPGCPFEPRCDRATPFCRENPPSLEELGPGHLVSCWEAKK